MPRTKQIARCGPSHHGPIRKHELQGYHGSKRAQKQQRKQKNAESQARGAAKKDMKEKATKQDKDTMEDTPDMPAEFHVTLGPTRPDGQIFTVQNCLLTKSSFYFKEVCKHSEFCDGKNTIDLLKHQPDIFAIYLRWLQTDELVVTDEDPPPSDAVEDIYMEFVARTYSALVSVYVLAVDLIDKRAQNCVIDGILSWSLRCGRAPGASDVMMTYPDTPRKSMLNRLFVDLFVYDVGAGWLAANSSKLHCLFLQDMIIAFASARESGSVASPYEMPKCTYHEHCAFFAPSCD